VRLCALLPAATAHYMARFRVVCGAAPRHRERTAAGHARTARACANRCWCARARIYLVVCARPGFGCHSLPLTAISGVGTTVYQDGTLCLDIIQNKWSPSYTVSSVLTSIQSLLTDPNCGSPANPEAAELFMQDKKAYNRRVRRLTEESLGGA
jgi:hypothetical protein